MKKINKTFLVAFVLAVTAALATEAKMINVSGYYQIDDNPSTEVDETACILGVVDQPDCPEFFGTVQCTITAGGIAHTAFSNRSTDMLTCLAPTLVRRP